MRDFSKEKRKELRLNLRGTSSKSAVTLESRMIFVSVPVLIAVSRNIFVVDFGVCGVRIRGNGGVFVRGNGIEYE